MFGSIHGSKEIDIHKFHHFVGSGDLRENFNKFPQKKDHYIKIV